jgi:hypothetical protein
VAKDRPILNALKQAFAALIPVLVALLLKIATQPVPAVKVASQTGKGTESGNPGRDDSGVAV